MSESKSDGTPWEARGDFVGPLDRVYDAAGYEVASVALYDGDTTTARARLIAAAPDLLAAAESALECLNMPQDFAGHSFVEADLRAALAKARIE